MDEIHIVGGPKKSEPHQMLIWRDKKRGTKVFKVILSTYVQCYLQKCVHLLVTPAKEKAYLERYKGTFNPVI